MSKIRRNAACLGTLALLLAGCGAGGTKAANDQAITVGGLFPTTGDVAAAGTNAQHGVELAIDACNGKVPGISIPSRPGKEIKLITADTQGNPEVGAQAVDRLVRNDGAVAIIGAYQSTVTLTASARAERLQIPFLNGASGAGNLSDRGLKWWFRTGPTSSAMADIYFAFLKSLQASHPVKNVAIIHMNDTYGNDAEAQWKRAAEASGVNVVSTVSFEPNATDLTSQVQAVRAKNPDAVFTTMFIRDTDLFLKTMDQLNYRPPALLAVGGGWDDPGFVKIAAGRGNGNIRAIPWSMQVTQRNATAAKVVDAFKKKYGDDMNGDSSRTYTAGVILCQALGRATSTKAEDIRTALKETDVTETIMPWAGVKFDERGQNTKAGYLIQQMTAAGTWEVIFPENLKTADVNWPMPKPGTS